MNRLYLASRTSRHCASVRGCSERALCCRRTRPVNSFGNGRRCRLHTFTFGMKGGLFLFRPFIDDYARGKKQSPTGSAKARLPIYFFVQGAPYRWMGMTFHTHLFGLDDLSRKIFLLGSDSLGRDLFEDSLWLPILFEHRSRGGLFCIPVWGDLWSLGRSWPKMGGQAHHENLRSFSLLAGFVLGDGFESGVSAADDRSRHLLDDRPDLYSGWMEYSHSNRSRSRCRTRRGDSMFWRPEQPEPRPAES